MPRRNPTRSLAALAATLTALSGCSDQAQNPSFASPPGGPALAVAGSNRTSLGTLGGSTSTAYDVDGGGVVVGTSKMADGSLRAFRWSQAGGMTALPAGTTHAYAISSTGAVAGRGVFGTSTRGFIWTPGAGSGTLRQLPLGVPGASAGEAKGLNAAGQAVGFVLVSGRPKAVLWTPDPSAPGGYRTTQLGSFGGADSEALGISSDGTVVGWATGYGSSHLAFRWTPTSPNATTGSIAQLPRTGTSEGEAHDINDAGQIVGWVSLSVRHPVRWDPGAAAPVYLSSFTTQGTATTVGEARALSDAGAHMSGVNGTRARAFAPHSDGLDLSAPTGASAAYGISPDGAMIVGAAGGIAALWRNVVTNAAPEARVASMDNFVDVGDTLVLDARLSSDQDGDALTYRWLSSNREEVLATGPTFPYAKPFATADYIYLVATDDDARSDTTPFWVYVNTPPVAVVAGNDTVQVPEGQVYRLDGSGSYDPDGHVLRYRWRPNDGTEYPSRAVNKAYADNGTYIAKFVVLDSVNSSVGRLNRADTAQVVVVVSNVAPTATLSFTAGREGSARTLSLTDVVEPSPTDAVSLQYAFDCGAGFGAYGSSPTASCPAVPDQDTVTIGARVRDKDGGVSTYTRAQYIANVVPVVTGGASSTSVRVGDLVTVVGSFADPGADAPWTWSYDWGNGVKTRGGTSSTTLPPSGHRYTTPGTYTLRITVSDDRGVGAASPVTITVSP